MDFTHGVITEYSAPSAELVNAFAKYALAKSISSDELDSIREMIMKQYEATGDITKIPLTQLLQLPEFRELAKQKLPREYRELFDEFHKLKKFLDEE